MDSTARNYLFKTKIEEISSNLTKDVVYVDTETTLEHTCKLLGQNNISAVPIHDVKQNKFVGIIDLVDIAMFISFAYDQKRKEAAEGVNTFDLEIFKDARASDLLPISEEGKLMWSFNPKWNIETTLEPFSKGIHRGLVTTEGDYKYHILSQVDVVKYLYESGQFNELFSKTLQDLPVLFEFKPKTVSITADTPAIVGFKKLGRSRVAGIAVLDSEGKLVGNLSASDLRGVAVDYLIKTILRPASDFLELVHGGANAKPIVATYDESFGSLVNKMLQNRVHRVWVVDYQGKLDTLVTFSDVCRVFANA